MPHHSRIQPLVDNHRRKGGGRVVTQVIIISFLLSLSWYDIILFELTDGQPIPKRKRLKRWHVQPIKNPEHLSVHPSPTQTTSWPLRHQWRTETRRPGQMHDWYLQGHEQTFYTHRLRTISFCQVPTPLPRVFDRAHKGVISQDDVRDTTTRFFLANQPAAGPMRWSSLSYIPWSFYISTATIKISNLFSGFFAQKPADPSSKFCNH